MDERLNGRLVQVPQIAGGLPRLLPEHHRLGADESEGINDDLHVFLKLLQFILIIDKIKKGAANHVKFFLFLG